MTSQSWDPAVYKRNAGFVAELGLPVLEWLAPRPGERILDLGCGEGALTAKLAALGCSVVGVDASAEQIAAAQARGLDARVMDGGRLDFEAEFDAVFSNAALHWMLDPSAVIAGVRRALKPGGRFVAEFGGGANVQRIHHAMIEALDRRGLDGRAASPWFFPDETQYRALLEQGGFHVERIELFERPTPLPGPLVDWLDTFGESFLSKLPEAERPRAKQEVAEAVAGELRNPDGSWWADYVRIRFAARRD